MFKKIVLTSILLLTIGVLVFGAINRTQAKTESEVAGRGGPGRGLETGQSTPATTDSAAIPQNAGNGYQGGGNATGYASGEHIYPAGGCTRRLERRRSCRPGFHA